MTAAITPPGTPLDERLRLLSVENDHGCWVWIACTDKAGYGRVSVERKPDRAHRIAYRVWVGPIPDGMTVDHLCFNTSCINPAHLRLLTNSENARNQRKAFKTHCVNGHEFTAENTLIRGNRRTGRTQRACRICRTASDQRAYARRVAARMHSASAA